MKTFKNLAQILSILIGYMMVEWLTYYVLSKFTDLLFSFSDYKAMSKFLIADIMPLSLGSTQFDGPQSKLMKNGLNPNYYPLLGKQVQM